jgi:hypothetical protein
MIVLEGFEGGLRDADSCGLSDIANGVILLYVNNSRPGPSAKD